MSLHAALATRSICNQITTHQAIPGRLAVATRGGSVAKIRKGKTIGVKVHFLLRLDNQSKQVSDEQNLSRDVPFFHSVHLSLAKHIHTLISL